ncbi:MAG TPA: hypothetical protein ENK11_08715 [Phycisphaerales bacterium]|nr:hypothetical protein [Phycisphaerales bacterium]
MSNSREIILRELRHQVDIHRKEIDQLGISFHEDSIELCRDTWLIPATVSKTVVDSTDVLNLLRTMRRSLRNKTNADVSVFVDAEEHRTAV